MRFFQIAPIALVSFLGIMACSDDSVGEVSTESVNAQTNDDDPIVEEENVRVDSTSLAISGVVEIGPFVAGGVVSFSEFDVESLKISEFGQSAEIVSNTGDYKIEGTFHSAYASVLADGNFFNFQTLDTTGHAVLRAMAKVDGKNTLNVNLLTELEYSRVIKLIRDEHLSFMEAKRTAERDIRKAFHFESDTTLFENVSLYGTGTQTQNLLAATTILLGERSLEEFSSLVQSISNDIEDNGKWDNDSLRASLADEAYWTSVDYIAYNIAQRGNVEQVELFEPAVMNFWANEYGLGACADSSVGKLVQNKNKLSTNYEKYFRCSGDEWLIASESMLLDLKMTEVFGKCTEKNMNVIETDSNGDSYICKKNSWSLATEAELENKMVSEKEGACGNDNNTSVVSMNADYYVCVGSNWKKLTKKPIDYSKGRAMNKRLGQGINLGNSWESVGKTGSDADCGWSNCIEDGYFKIVKEAGFKSVRIPVRWNTDAEKSEPYTLDAGRLSGVKEDVSLAIAQGLAVIVNIHHYNEMLSAAANYKKNKDGYEKEKARMVGMWKQIAKEFDSFPDSLVVLEIINEPNGIDNVQLNDFISASYKVIRENAPGKTIMFESNGFSKFAQIVNLNLPDDGNIIVSGHYYEPYTITHQGHGYDCANSLRKWSVSTVQNQFRDYVESVASYFPDINGGYVPMNMGEFGVSGQNGSSCGNNGVSDSLRAIWTDAVIAEAEKYGMSWQYWGFVGVGGFEAYDKWGGKWYPELLQVFNKYTK